MDTEEKLDIFMDLVTCNKPFHQYYMTEFPDKTLPDGYVLKYDHGMVILKKENQNDEILIPGSYSYHKAGLKIINPRVIQIRVNPNILAFRIYLKSKDYFKYLLFRFGLKFAQKDYSFILLKVYQYI